MLEFEFFQENMEQSKYELESSATLDRSFLVHMKFILHSYVFFISSSYRYCPQPFFERHVISIQHCLIALPNSSLKVASLDRSEHIIGILELLRKARLNFDLDAYMSSKDALAGRQIVPLILEKTHTAVAES